MTKFIFTWENLRYEITEKNSSIWETNRRKRIIINGVSGSAFSTSLIAILGVSGCGKTTLLTLLSGQRRGQGVLKLNGRIITGKILRSNSAFLQQKDLFLDCLTVHEHMTFMAAMCIQKSYSSRAMTVQKLLKDLSIEHLKYTEIKHLSTGEKRKLSLAANLLDDPYILFCDEPTTGMDSYSAISVVKILESIAALGKIVFLTVHQPSSPLFALFDNIILMSTNGKVVFQGTRENAKLFFGSQNLYCPTLYNPADFYIKSIAIREPSDEKRIEHLIKAFDNEYAVTFNFADLDYNGLLLKHKTDKKHFFYTLWWLSWRVLIEVRRNVNKYATNFVLMMVAVLIIGATYASTTLADISSVQSIQGALLLIVSELIFNGMYQVIFIFPNEIELFIREKNLYAALPYFLSKIASLVPFGIVISFGFLTVYFTLLQFLGTFKLFWQMYLILIGASLGGSALGLCLSALFPTIESMHLFIVPLELMCLLLSGLWIKIDTLPRVFSAVKYFSPFYVSFESLSILYWMKVDSIDSCTDATNVPCYHNGTEVLHNYDFIPDYDKVLKNCWYLLLLIMVYCYIGYIGILRKRALYHI